MSSPINQIVAEIKYTTIYKCYACGKEKSGTSKRIIFDGGSTAELKKFLDDQPQRSYQMPVGWSYNGRFTCEYCRGK